MSDTFKSDSKRSRTNINHHFHYVVPSLVRDFAFMRISKSASNSIRKYQPFGLNHNNLIHASLYPYEIYCCIRNPIDRFISSIPETLLRYTVRHLSKKNWSSAVYVSEDVSVRLDALTQVNDPSVFLFEYLSLISEGPFDAHHQPQVDFITNQNLELIRPMSFFLLDRMNDAFQLICLNYDLNYTPLGHKNAKVTITSNAIKKTPWNANLKSKATNLLYRSFAKCNLYHVNFSEPVVNKWSEHRTLAIHMAREIKSLVRNDPTLQSEIKQLYAQDTILYDRLSDESSAILNLRTLNI